MTPNQAYEILKNNSYKDITEKQNCLDIIKTNPQYACYYAKYVIKDRWIEGEDIIKTSPYYACDYAKNVIKGRWTEAEESIKSSTALVKYCKSINQRIVEKEYLLKGKSKIDYYIYFNIQLEEEDLNKEIANCLIGKKSKYLAKVQKEKTLAIKHIKNLIDLGLISENDCIKNLINNQ